MNRINSIVAMPLINPDAITAVVFNSGTNNVAYNADKTPIV